MTIEAKIEQIENPFDHMIPNRIYNKYSNEFAATFHRAPDGPIGQAIQGAIDRGDITQDYLDANDLALDMGSLYGYAFIPESGGEKTIEELERDFDKIASETGLSRERFDLISRALVLGDLLKSQKAIDRRKRKTFA